MKELVRTCKCGCGRVVNGHMTYAKGHRLLIPEPTLFWDQVEITETCWLWKDILTPEGYGQFRTGRRKEGTYRKELVHIWAYKSLVGPIPEGLHLDHLCRVRNCVNPSHLEPVTIRENVLRGVGVTAQLAKVTHCPEGHLYEGENLYIAPSGARMCRECRRSHVRNWYERSGREWHQRRYVEKKRKASRIE